MLTQRGDVMRKNKTFVALFLAVILPLGACTTYKGIAEYQTYRSAYEKAYAVGSQILDLLAVAERESFHFLNPEAARAPVRPFEPGDSAFYSDNVDPPDTAAFQRSLDVVKTYNDLLYGLASGESAASMTAKLGDFGAKVKAAGKETAGLLGTPGAAAVVSTIDASLRSLLPFIELGLRYRSRSEFRKFLVNSYDDVAKILGALKSGTAVIFPVLTLGIERKAFPRSFSADQIKKISEYRKLLSDWVLLLDASEKALDTAVASLRTPATLDSVLGGLTASAVEIELIAKSASKHVAQAATS